MFRPKLVLATDSLAQLRKTAGPKFVWPKMATPALNAPLKKKLRSALEHCAQLTFIQRS